MNSGLIVMVLLCFAAEPTKSKANHLALLDELADAGTRTVARLEREGAKWTVRQDIPKVGAVRIDVEQFPEASFQRMSVELGARTDRIFDLTIAEGYWHVFDGRTRTRYRPFEASFPLPTAVHFLANSDLKYFSAALRETVVGVDSEDVDKVVVRVRPSDDQRATLNQLIATFNELTKKREARKQSVTGEPVEQMKLVSDHLKRGFPMSVDRQTGLVLDHGPAPKEIHFRDFEWLGTQRPRHLRIDAKQWDDQSKPFTRKELEDVIQISRNGIWQPGAPSGGDTDLMLLNVTSGNMRRVPFPFGLAQSGCFSKDRTRVFVSGVQTGSGLHLFEVNLQSGDTKPIGGAEFRRGVWLGPTISPDGRFLAACQIFSGEGLQNQIHVLELNTGQSRRLGKPMDIAFLEWHPHKVALLCADREPTSDYEVPKSFITVISMDGTTKRLCEGGFPCLLPRRDRILFEDANDERRLKTCDLNGRDVRLFGDGFKGYGFPAPSPDGQRMVLMRFEPPKPPRPYLVDLDSLEVSPIKVGSGLWGRPKWQ